MTMVSLYLFSWWLWLKFKFQWDGTGCSGFYWEEEYVELVQKYLAQHADMAANEAVIQPKKPKDVEQTGICLF